MHLEELWNRQPNNCWCEQHLQGTPVFPLQFMTHLHGKDSAWFWNRVSCRLWGFSEHLTSVNIVSWARPGFFYWRLPPPPPPLFPSFPFPTLYQCKHACPLSFLKGGSWLGSQDLQAIHIETASTQRRFLNVSATQFPISEVVVQRQCTNPWHDRPAIQSCTA